MKIVYVDEWIGLSTCSNFDDFCGLFEVKLYAGRLVLAKVYFQFDPAVEWFFKKSTYVENVFRRIKIINSSVNKYW